MPFQSEKQRRYMHANLPRIAKRWERDYANGGIIALAQGGRIGFYKGSDRHGGTGGRTSSGMDMSGATNVGGTTGSGLGGGPHGGGEWSGPTYSPPKTKTFTGPNIHGEGIGSQTFDINKRTIALQDQYRQGASQRAHPFLSKVKSGIGNIFHGLGNKIFQGRGNYKNQAAWEQARQDRIDKKSINRLRKTRDYGKYANNPQGWAGSDLSGRLTGLEKDVFGQDYVDYSRTTPKARDLKALRDKQALTSQLSARDYKPQGFMENLQSKFGNEVRPAAAVKPNFLQEQSWYRSPLKLRQGLISTALGDDASEKMQAFQELKSLVPHGTLTIEKYLNLAQQNKIPSILVEDMNKQVLEAIKKQGGFGDTFPKNYSLGNIKPTIKDGRIDIDETKIDDDYKDRLKYLEVAEGGLAGLWPR